MLLAALRPAELDAVLAEPSRSKMVPGPTRRSEDLDTLLERHLPQLLRTAGEVSVEWALWQSRPHVELLPDALRAPGGR